MKKKCFLLFATVLVFFAFAVSCGKSDTARPSYTSYHTMSAPDAGGVSGATGFTDKDSNFYNVTVNVTGSSSGAQQGGDSFQGANRATYAQNAPEATTSKYKKSGTVFFSDSSDNEYIAAVVSAYGEDAALLAAIYTVPHGDDNTVLCFDGTLDSDGTPLRNAETLRYVYTVDASYNIKRASENAAENSGYGSAESRVMFYAIRHYLIPEYESELG